MTRHAVLIGCDNYKNSADFPTLRCAPNDVDALIDVLKDSEVGNFARITKFTAGEDHTTVLTHIEDLLMNKVKSNDTVLIYFSGHAAVDRLDNLHLAVHPTDKRTLASTSIPMSRIISFVGSSRCQDAVVVLDCCYSGAARNAFQLPTGWTGRGFSIVTSSTDVEESKAKEGEVTSIFTKFLLEGLASGHADLDSNGVITVDEAYQYTHGCVRATGLQTPMHLSIRQGSIELAKNKYYQKPPDASQVPHEELQKFLAISNMIQFVREHPDCLFMVMLLPHYFIESEAYRASALTVSSGHTPNIRQTIEGFECDAFFQPHMLTAQSKKGKEVVNGLIKVRMEVRSENIMLISGKVGGQQVNLLSYSGGTV